MCLLATRLDEAAGEITRLQGASVSVGLPITAPAELAHYERPLRDLVEWCHSSAADLRRRAAVAAQADLIDREPFGGKATYDALKTAAAGGVDTELAAFDALSPDGDAAAFFAGLAPGRGLAVAMARASQVGARAGVPFELRFAANRHLVCLAHAEALRTGDQAAAQRYTKLLAPDRRLLLFDVRGAGRIAEVKGDLNTAVSVAIMVPGTGSNLANFDAGPVSDMRTLHTFADQRARGTVATIMWLGAEMPPNVGAAALDLYADRGAPKLRDFVAGLGLPGEVRTTLIGHSYGSTLTGHAVRAGLHPDNLVAVASPGWGVDHVTELRAPTTSLFAVRHPHDFISVIPSLEDGVRGAGLPAPSSIGHGNDPILMRHVTRLASGYDDAFLQGGFDLAAHSDYFGGEGRARTATNNLARVVTGEDPVTFDEARKAL